MTIRPYHAAVWNEPLIHEQTSPGERGVLLPVTEPEILQKIGSTDYLIPIAMRRKHAPPLPELSQAQVLRHWLRLSQMTLGMELDIDLSVGTCTMKYSPKVNERLVTEIMDIHPDQPEETMQGLLEIAWRLGHIYLKEISGMDEWTFQPPGGSAGAFNNAAIMRKYHQDNGELKQRDEIITTITPVMPLAQPPLASRSSPFTQNLIQASQAPKL
jgi:glycine dehydrogenase subunit 2